MENGSKKCTKCLLLKPYDAFYKQKAFKDRYTFKCKECIKQSRKEYYSKNKELCARQMNEYRLRNQEYFTRKNKEYYRVNRERFRITGSKWRSANPGKILELRQRYYLKN